MKIIQVTPKYPPSIGGAQQRIKDLSDRLAKKGLDVEVFTSDIDCPKNMQLKSKKNLKINYLKTKEYLNTPIIPSLYKELMKIPQDSIIHVHIAQAYIPEIVYKIWKKRGIPYIAHIRMNVEPSTFLGKFMLKPYKAILLKKVLENAKKIIVLNKDYFNLVKNKYGISEEKIEIIPNATSFKVVTSKSFKQKSKINLLAVGRLGIQKNYPNVIKSLSLLPKKIKNKIILNIIGEGPQRKELEILIKKLHLEKNVFLKGKIFGKDLEKSYEESDLFILASNGEGFSTTLLEAMSKGLPIITSNVIGNRCVVKNKYNGYLCGTDPISISKTISKTINNKKYWREISRNNLKEIKKYSWNKIIKQTKNTYKEIVDGKIKK